MTLKPDHDLRSYGTISLDDGVTEVTVCRCSECGKVHIFFDLDTGERAGAITLPPAAAGLIGTALIRCTTPNA